jgi:hypothetical protein
MEDKPKFPDEARQFFAAHGREGGKIRAKNLTRKQRSQIARKAARARWTEEGKDHGRKDS